MTLERRTQALLDLIEDDRAARCAGIERQAESRAHAALHEACGNAREDVRAAFAEERRRAADVLAGARARLATQRRHTTQRRAAALLATGLEKVPRAFERQWCDAVARARWIDAILEACAAVLPATAWQVVHPPGWADDEMQVVAARIAGLAGAAPRFASDPRIVGGLRVAAVGIVVDGTDAGLCSDKAAVGARLLGLLAAQDGVEGHHG